MSRLPDHHRMRTVARNLHRGRGDWTFADEARVSFDAALCETLILQSQISNSTSLAGSMVPWNVRSTTGSSGEEADQCVSTGDGRRPVTHLG